MPLVFGTKKRYKYKKGEHICHECNKPISKGLQLHHHGKKKSDGGSKVKPVHDKCHAKKHGNYNHVLSYEDRRKAGLKTYKNNLRNMKKSSMVSVTRGKLNGSKTTTQSFSTFKQDGSWKTSDKKTETR